MQTKPVVKYYVDMEKPSCVGILQNHYKDPGSLLNNQYNGKW